MPTDFVVLSERGYVVTRGKHEGKTLEEIRKVHPNFLVFLFKKCATLMSEEAFYAVTDTMIAEGFDPANPRPRKNSPDTGDVGVDSPAD